MCGLASASKPLRPMQGPQTARTPTLRRGPTPPIGYSTPKISQSVPRFSSPPSEVAPYRFPPLKLRLDGVATLVAEKLASLSLFHPAPVEDGGISMNTLASFAKVPTVAPKRASTGADHQGGGRIIAVRVGETGNDRLLPGASGGARGR